MKRHVVRVFAVLAAVMFMSITVLELNAHARAGGSRSMGSRGSRSYSRPASSSPQQSQSRQQYAPSPSPFQQQAGGGLMRGMAGGIMGGMLGSSCSAALPEQEQAAWVAVVASACLKSFFLQEEAISFTAISRKKERKVPLINITGDVNTKGVLHV